jgi:hypothetical protein
MWLQRQEDPACAVHALTAGSLIGTDMLVTMAFHKKFHTIGWHSMFNGRISKLWGHAMCEITKSRRSSLSKTWTAQIILYLWKYTRSLWTHRNQVVHGKTDQEIATKLRESSLNQVQNLCTMFQTNSNFILSRHHYLFTTRSLEQHLHMDIDSLTCWLRSGEDAKQALVSHNTQLLLQSNPFFAPFYEIGRTRAHSHSPSSDSTNSNLSHNTSSHVFSTTNDTTFSSSQSNLQHAREEDQVSTTATSVTSLNTLTDISSLGTFISTGLSDPPHHQLEH